MKILVTGPQGFIAKNLIAHLQCMDNMEVISLGRNSSLSVWEEVLSQADVIFHLAGVNRPPDPTSFQKDNNDLTQYIVDSLEKRRRPYQLFFSSSTQAIQDNPYGQKQKECGGLYLQKCKIWQRSNISIARCFWKMEQAKL